MSRRKPRPRLRQPRPARSRRPHARPLRFEPLEDRRLLTAVTVNTVSDDTDLNDGFTTFREAIFIANSVPGIDAINFDPSLTAFGSATILLTHGELDISTSISVNGPGADRLTIDASGNDPIPGHPYPSANFDGSRVFRIDDGTDVNQTVTISGLKIAGGDVSGDGGGVLNYEHLTLSHCEVSSNFASGFGSGIANFGEATILNSAILDNGYVSALPAYTGVGGGLYTAENLTVALSTISGNTAVKGGGIAVGNFDGYLSVSKSAISHNTATSGGGIYAAPFSAVSIDSSTINGNQAKQGGGVFSSVSRFSLANSTVAENDSSSQGGGLYLAANSFISANISHCTIASNSAIGSSGGGIYLAFGNLNLSQTIVAAKFRLGWPGHQ